MTGYCGQTIFNALVNIDHLINKKARPQGAGAGRAIINENMPSSGAPPGFPDCPQSLKQCDCPRSSSEHALRLVRKTLLKGRGLLETVPLHGASLLLVGRVRESPTRSETGRATHGPIAILPPMFKVNRGLHT